MAGQPTEEVLAVNNESRNEAYLGDSVYIEHDGYALRLSTDNGYGPENVITIDPEVFDALTRYIVKCNLLPYREIMRKINT